MKKGRFLLLVWFLLSYSLFAYAETPIKVIYWKSSDIQTPSQDQLDSLQETVEDVQSFFASEMDRHGFGEKTFDFDDIEVVEGKLKHHQYTSLWTMVNESDEMELGFDKQIFVVFLGGASTIGNANGVSQPLCLNIPDQIVNCNNLIVVPAEDSNALLPLVAHELGHAFGLFHPKQRLIGTKVDVMYYPLHVIIGVKMTLNNFVFSLKDATILNDGGRLSVSSVEEDKMDSLEEYTTLIFEGYTSENAITPINSSDEWDGWVIGVWEKLLEGVIPPKNPNYFNFPEMETLSHWMYSHAPSKIIYDVSDKSPTKFGTYFLLPNKSTTGMSFTAHADNVEIYAKNLYVADSGIYIEFEIPQGTEYLTLIIGDMGNMTGDHYVLGEPKLFDEMASYKETDRDIDDIDTDVNDDGYTDLYDCLIVRSGMSTKSTYDTDINDDGVTNILDLMLVKAAAFQAIAAAAPSKRKIKLTTWGKLKTR